jgi:DNA-binding response OmpR family regulator
MLFPRSDPGVIGVDTARRLAKNASALVLVRDESVREIVATALSELSRLLVFQTGSTTEAMEELAREPEVLVLGPAFRDREIEELLETIGEGAPPIVLLMTDSTTGGLVLGHDVVAIEAPFDLDRLAWAIEEAIRRRRPAQSGTVAKA